MKKSIHIINSFIISLLLFSCSNSKDLTEESSELFTIKSVVSQIENDTVWSVELEGERLTQPVKNDAPFLSEGHTLTVENAKLSAALLPAVYPGFKNFASLDISSLEYKFIESASDFSSQISTWNQEKLFSNFPSNFRFNYIFFEEELKKGWKNNFNHSFPEKNTEEEDEDFRIFDKWILGQAAVLDNLIQFPVRFYCNMGYLDVTLYMSPDKANILYNIKIERWEKYD